MRIRHFRPQYNERLDQWRVQWIPGWFPRWWPFWVTPQATAEDGSRQDLVFDNSNDMVQHIADQLAADCRCAQWHPALRDGNGRWLRGQAWVAEANRRFFPDGGRHRIALFRKIQSLFERNHHGSDSEKE